VRLLENSLKKLVRSLIRTLDIRGPVSVAIVEADEIHRINREFLDRDRATNVISFNYGDADLFGEVVVSIDAAMSEGGEFGHEPDEHLAYLVLHGLLHLAGYHHEPGSREAARARELQEELFKAEVLPFLEENPIFG